MESVINDDNKRRFVCGTRVWRKHEKGYWVVECSACGCGGSVKHATKELAGRAAVRDSGKACKKCGHN